ncbi:MAG: MBL fold metallo-hydrolase [Myxococcales bacterium]
MGFECGFETVGNATIILHDGAPLLASDPWITGPAYFGSWGLAHEVPPEQFESVKRCKYIWVSHGHPDHLSGDSMALLKDKIILVPDHRGKRIYEDLRAQGFNVQIAPDYQWIELSPRVRVLSIADYNQDGVLICDVNGRLVLNLNDASDRGWGGFVRKLARKYSRVFILSLCGFGDADMMNFWGEDGRMLPLPEKTPLGRTLCQRAEIWGANAAIPFSAMHRFQRTDSAWANRVSATMQDYRDGFDTSVCDLLPAYVRYDCVNDDVTPLNPKATSLPLLDPKEFGDDWSERLEHDEKLKLRKYFLSFEAIRRNIDFLRFVVGGEETLIELRRANFRRGLTFEVPRGSLMKAVDWEIFDDLLIGNFMKVTLHGEWGFRDFLYPDFTPWVAKYGDNGRAKTLKELREYHLSYFRRAPVEYIKHRFDAGFLLPLQEQTASLLRSRLGANSTIFQTARKAYWTMRTWY